MLKRLWLLIAALLISFGCSGSPLPDPETGYKCGTESKHLTRNVYIDETFTTEERLWITLAMLEWNRVTNNVMEFRYEGTVTHIVLSQLWRYPGTSTLYVLRGQEGDPIPSENATLWGKANWNFVVLVTDRIKAREGGDYQKRVTAVAMHELGHTIGIGHIPETTALMNASCALACRDPKITMYDMNGFCHAAQSDWRWPEAVDVFEDHAPE